MKTQSNQDIREQRISPPSPSPSSTSRVTQNPKINSETVTEQENRPPTQTSNTFPSRVEDIRFHQARTSSAATSIPSYKSNTFTKPKASNENPRPAFYNRGQPRTYLSDRHVRNIDVRELSSRVSHGYQYPSPAAQSSGPMKKIPEGFTRPKALPKTFTSSKLARNIIYLCAFTKSKLLKNFSLERSRHTVPVDQIKIGIQPEAQFQVDTQPISGADQEPDGRFLRKKFCL